MASVLLSYITTSFLFKRDVGSEGGPDAPERDLANTPSINLTERLSDIIVSIISRILLRVDTLILLNNQAA